MANIRQLITQEATLGGTWRQLAKLTSVLAEASLAVECARRYAVARPHDPVAQLEHVALLARFDQVQDALQAGQKLAATHPELASAHYQVGLCHAQLNEADEAVSALRRAIALRPGAGDAWVVLATVKKFADNDPDLARLRQLHASIAEATPETRGGVCLALGKAYDDLGDFERAFDCFAEAGRIYAARQPFDSGRDAEAVRALIRNFDAPFATRLTPKGPASDRPIFVFGMPRSGTTLVEQILTAHTAVADGGEINLVVPAIFGLDAYDPAVITAYLRSRPPGDAPWRRFGEDYLHLLSDRFGPDGRIVDKTLNTSRFLGIICAMLPGSRLIWMRRDPGDVALSCFRTLLREGAEWSWSLGAIGHYMRHEDLLHAHWQSVFADKILTVPYEDLVHNSEHWIPRILAHCELEDQPGTRRFYESTRAVRTASMSQVRRPISAGSIGSWKRYERQLSPFFAAYRS